MSDWTAQLVVSLPVNRSSLTIAVTGSPFDAGGPLASVVYSWRSVSGSTAGGADVGRADRLSLVGGVREAASISLLSLVDGTYMVWVHGLDRAGNRSPRPCANATFIVDLTPPVRCPSALRAACLGISAPVP